MLSKLPNNHNFDKTLQTKNDTLRSFKDHQ